MDTRQVIARFEAERQALALMDHADIARVFDAGATLRRPALFRHGIRRWRAHHEILRRASALHGRAPGTLSPASASRSSTPTKKASSIAT